MAQTFKFSLVVSESGPPAVTNVLNPDNGGTPVTGNGPTAPDAIADLVNKVTVIVNAAQSQTDAKAAVLNSLNQL